MLNILNIIKNFRYEYSNFSTTVKYLIIMEVFSSIGGGIFSFIFIFYIVNLGYSTVFYGALSSVSGFSYLLMALPIGIISSRIGSRKMLFIGSFFSIIFILIYVITSNVLLLYSGAVISGLAQAFSSPNFNSLLSKASEEKRRNFVFSFNGFVNLIGSTLGITVSGLFPSLGKFLFRNNLMGFKLALLTVLILWTISLILIRFLKDDIKIKREERKKVPREILKTMLKLTIPASLIGLGAGFVIPYFQLQFQYRFHLGISAISYIFSITTFAMAILMLFVPFLARKRGSLSTIVTFQVIAALLLLSMPFSSNLSSMGLYFFSALYFFRTILMNVTGPVQSSFELTMIPEEFRPFMSSLVSLSWIGMNSISVYFGGIIMNYSLNLPFYICASFYVTSSILYYIFFKNVIKK